jgi:hypothetical protein
MYISGFSFEVMLQPSLPISGAGGYDSPPYFKEGPGVVPALCPPLQALCVNPSVIHFNNYRRPTNALPSSPLTSFLFP